MYKQLNENCIVIHASLCYTPQQYSVSADMKEKTIAQQKEHFAMITCATCGRLIPDNATSCPGCGALTEFGRATRSQSGEFQQQGYTSPDYLSGYAPPTGQSSGYNPQQGYVPPQQQYGYQQQQGYAQQPNYGPYQQGGVNVTVVNNATASHSNAPVIVELLLNIFTGIYGVGWLMAGETTTGIILLVCSFVDWGIWGALFVFTLGLGFLCWGPLLIAAIIVNAILLNNALKRKASQIITVQQHY